MGFRGECKLRFLDSCPEISQDPDVLWTQANPMESDTWDAEMRKHVAWTQQESMNMYEEGNDQAREDYYAAGGSGMGRSARWETNGRLDSILVKLEKLFEEEKKIARLNQI